MFKNIKEQILEHLPFLSSFL